MEGAKVTTDTDEVDDADRVTSLEDDDDDTDNRPVSDILDEITGQKSLFKDEEEE